MRRVVVTGMGATPLRIECKRVFCNIKAEIMDLESFPSLMLQNTKHTWLQK